MRWVVVAGVVVAGAIVVAIAAFSDSASGGDEPSDSVASAPEGADRRAAGSGFAHEPVTPRRFSASSSAQDASGPTIVEEFLMEAVDEAWAEPQAAEVSEIAARVVADAPVTVSEAKCRSSLCTLDVSSRQQQAFLQVIERMQGSDGYFGVAKTLHLTGMRKTEDGGQYVTVVLRFER